MKKITWKEISNSCEWLTLCNEGFEKNIKYFGVSRVGLELSGEYLKDSIDITVLLGGNERSYLSKFPSEIVKNKLIKILKSKPPLIILSRSFDYELIRELAIEYKVSIFKSCYSSSETNVMLTTDLMTKLSEEKTIHANLMEVYGMGIMILGESGLGKSEICLELIKKGHLFISDDVVLYKKILDKIIGKPDDRTRGFIEVRGLGIINIVRLYGIKCLKESCNIDIIVELEHFDHQKTYERLGEKYSSKELFDIKIPYYKVPVSSGRQISDIIEVIASDQKLRETGYSSFEDFQNSFKMNRENN